MNEKKHFEQKIEADRSVKRERISDFLVVVGGIAVSVGVGLLHVACGIIVGGALAMIYGWLIGRGGDE